MDHINSVDDGRPEPEEELDEVAKYRNLYRDGEFMDDISGAPLEKEAVIAARRLEIAFFRKLGVYTKRRRESWMKVITTKWLDVNKGDTMAPDIRSRPVGREIRRGKPSNDWFAATPPP